MNRVDIELTPEESAAIRANVARRDREFASIDADPNNGGDRSVRRRNLRAKAQVAAEGTERRILAGARERAVQAGVRGESRAFGYAPVPGGSLATFRAAIVTAAEIDTPGKALRLMISADQGGDPQLAAQIARRARQERGTGDLGGHWAQVLAAWRSAHPEHEGALADMDRGESLSTRDQVLQAMGNLRRPDDLRAVAVESWAKEADWTGQDQSGAA